MRIWVMGEANDERQNAWDSVKSRLRLERGKK